MLLGRYLISERLAVGGMAEVYLAIHGQLAGFETPVVIKRILPRLANTPEFIKMFLDEARIASLLRHPNIASILEVSKESDEYFLAMELVQGEPLSKILGSLYTKQVKLPPALAAFIASQVAAGLYHAHTSCDALGQPLHVVHRDISPQNILVTYDGAVKIIDFGIARAKGRLTQTGDKGTKGKLSYMSPEQARGEMVDNRSDIFSLGIVLWEMVAGVRLFRCENASASMDAILTEIPPRLGDFTSVSPFLETIVAQALAKNPQQRFSTALALETLLQRYVSEEGPAGTAELRRFMRQHFGKHQVAWRQRVRRALSQPTPTPTPMPTSEVPVVVERRPLGAIPGDVVLPIKSPRLRHGIVALAGLALAVTVALSLLLGLKKTQGSHSDANPIFPPVRPAKVDPRPDLKPLPSPAVSVNSAEFRDSQKRLNNIAPAKRVPKRKVAAKRKFSKPNPFQL
jgi:serine/threonine-protein kinase